MTKSKLTDIRCIFTNEDFKFVDPRTRKQYCFPNSWLWNETERVAVLVVWRSDVGTDFAVNKFALEYFVSSLAKNKIKECYVALADGKEGGSGQSSPIYIKHLPVLAAFEALIKHRAAHGQFGDYWWVDENLRVISNPSKPEYTNRPF